MRRVLPFLLLVVAVGRADAQPGKAITPDDYFTLNTITEVAVSPDGKRVAYTLATWDTKADNRRTDLWVVPTDGKGKPTQLTSDRANDRHPKWSADGKHLYVVGNRKKDGQKTPPFNGSAQVWKVPADGGDPVGVTKVEGGITGFDYAPKADAVFYSADASVSDEDDFAHLRKKFANPDYGHGKRTVSEVLRLDAKGGKPEKLIAEKLYVREFAVAPDGKRVAMVVAPDDTVIRSEGDSRVDVWEAGKIVTPPTDVYRKNAASPWAWLEGLAWNPDGTRFAFCAIFDAYPAEVVIGELTDGKWTTGLMNRRKTRSPGEREDPEGLHVRGYGTPLQWSRDGSLIHLRETNGTVASRTYVLKDEAAHVPSRSAKETSVEYAFHVSNGRAEVVGTAAGFPVLRAITQGNGWNELVDPNPHTRSWRIPSVEHVTWKAADRTDVGGILELPPGWKKGDKPLPLVVAIHGGPTTSSKADLSFDPHNGRLYFAAAGYAVLCPNYRGSTGYGDKFVTDLIGKENDIEVKDILAGIQHLIKEGIADPDRIGVMGWSNGGYLTNCLITLKDSPVKFKAASSGAGILDTVAEWGFNDEPAYPRVFKKGLPWETPDIYKKTSPTYGLGNVTTPTLIHVGGNDERCPPGHSRMLYRALKEYVKVPTELVVYPGEPHGLTKASNRKAKMEWDLAWFEKYLKK